MSGRLTVLFDCSYFYRNRPMFSFPAGLDFEKVLRLGRFCLFWCPRQNLCGRGSTGVRGQKIGALWLADLLSAVSVTLDKLLQWPENSAR